ncbi:hypothetical protein QFC20_000167 [Naganishia adeliensis]|uniref:Uncharacterized protein n=1 Tax=Naganishia adeliensis TaxID=92952 RepID=A0ACC2X3A5_9TREE|nr:hypothetical protein QFC20_000167 [Naganishia adeliensis]
MSEDAKPLLSPLPADADRTKPQAQGRYSPGPNRISFPPSSTSALYAGEDPDEYDLRTSGYRPTPTRNRSANNVLAGARQTENADLEARRDARPGLPKLSRESTNLPG